MIVELIGPSGCGKTTVAAAAIRASNRLRAGRRSLAVASGDSDRILGLKRALAAAPLTAMRLVMGGLAWTRFGTVNAAATAMFASRYSVQRRVRGVFMYDQGLVQTLVYMTRAVPDEQLHGVVGQLYSSLRRPMLPDLILSFEVRAEVAARRTKMSGNIHGDVAEVRRTIACVGVHEEHLRRRFGIPIVDVRNDGDVDEVAGHVLAAIDAAQAVI